MLFVWLCTLHAAGQQSAIYVDSDIGYDTANGSLLAPLKTLTKVSSLHLIGPVTVFLRGSFNETLLIFLSRIRGTAGSPVRYTSWDESNPAIIDNPTSIIITTIGSTGGYLGVEIDNLNLVGSGSGSWGIHCIAVSPGTWSYGRFSRLNIYNKSVAFAVPGFNGNTWQDFFIEDVSVWSSVSRGLSLQNMVGLVVSNFYASNTGPLCAISLTNTSNVVLEDSLIERGTGAGICVANPCHDMVIQRCTTRFNGANGISVASVNNTRGVWNLSITDYTSIGDGASSAVVFTNTNVHQELRSVIMRNIIAVRYTTAACVSTLEDSSQPAAIAMLNSYLDFQFSNISVMCNTPNQSILPYSAVTCPMRGSCNVTPGFVYSGWVGDYDQSLLQITWVCPTPHFITKWLIGQDAFGAISQIIGRCSDGTLSTQPLSGGLIEVSTPTGLRPSEIVVRLSRGSSYTSNAAPFGSFSNFPRIMQFMNIGIPDPSSPLISVMAPPGNTVAGYDLLYQLDGNLTAIRFRLHNATSTVQRSGWTQTNASPFMCPANTYVNTVLGTPLTLTCTTGFQAVCSDGTVLLGPTPQPPTIQSDVGFRPESDALAANATCSSVYGDIPVLNGQLPLPTIPNISLMGFSVVQPPGTSNVDIQFSYAAVTLKLPTDPRWSNWYGGVSSSIRTAFICPNGAELVNLTLMPVSANTQQIFAICSDGLRHVHTETMSGVPSVPVSGGGYTSPWSGLGLAYQLYGRQSGLRRTDVTVLISANQIIGLSPGLSSPGATSLSVTDIPSDARLIGYQPQYGAQGGLSMIRFAYIRGTSSDWVGTQGPYIPQHSECPFEAIITQLAIFKNPYGNIRSLQAVCSDGTVLGALWANLDPATLITLTQSTGFRAQDVTVRGSGGYIHGIGDMAPTFDLNVWNYTLNVSSRHVLIGFDLNLIFITGVRWLFSDVSAASDWIGNHDQRNVKGFCPELQRVITISVYTISNIIYGINAICSDGTVIYTGLPSLSLNNNHVTITTYSSDGFPPLSIMPAMNNTRLTVDINVDKTTVNPGDNSIPLPSYLNLVGIEVDTSPSTGVHAGIRFNFTSAPPDQPPQAYKWGSWLGSDTVPTTDTHMCSPGFYITSWQIALSPWLSYIQAHCWGSSVLSEGSNAVAIPWISAKDVGYRARDMFITADLVIWSMFGVGNPTLGYGNGYMGLGSPGGGAGIDPNWLIVGFQATYRNGVVTNLRFAYEGPNTLFFLSYGAVSYLPQFEPQIESPWAWTEGTPNIIWLIPSYFPAVNALSCTTPAFSFTPGYWFMTLDIGAIAMEPFVVVDYIFEIGIQQIAIWEGKGILQAVWEDGIVPYPNNLTFLWSTSCPIQLLSPDSILIPYSTSACVISLSASSAYSSYIAMASLIFLAPFPTIITNVSISGPIVINPQEGFTLTASTSALSQSTYLWSLSSAIALNGTSLTGFYSTACWTGLNQPTFSVSKDCLLPGVRYAISLEVSFATEATFALHTIKVRNSPTGGSCAIFQPDPGYTSLTINCTLWSTLSPYILYSLLGTSSTSSTATTIIPAQANNGQFAVVVVDAGVSDVWVNIMTPQLATTTVQLSVPYPGRVPDYLPVLEPQSWATFRWLTVSQASTVTWAMGGQNFTGSLLQLPPFFFVPGSYNFRILFASTRIWKGSFVVVDYQFTPIIQQTVLTPGLVKITAGWADSSGMNSAAAQMTVMWSLPLTCQLDVITMYVAQLTSSSATTVVCQLTIAFTTPFGQPQTLSQNITIPSSTAHSIPLTNLTVQGPFIGNPQDTLRLLGSFSSAAGINLIFNWSVSPNLPTLCLPTAGPNARGLAVSSTCLTPGASYQFVFIVIIAGTEQSVSTAHSYYVNSAPRGGNCSIIQPDPRMARVAVNCTGWVTDSPYLTYTITSSHEGGVQLPVSDPQTSSYFLVNVVPGINDLVVEVATSQGAITSITSEMNVTGTCPLAGEFFPASLLDASYALKCNATAEAWATLNATLVSTLQQSYVSNTDLFLVTAAVGTLVAKATPAQLTILQNDTLRYLTNISTLSPTGDSGIQLAQTLSGSLGESLATLPCSFLYPLLNSLQELSGKANSVTLPGEPTTILSSTISTTSTTAQYVSNDLTLRTGPVFVSVPSSAVGASSTGIAHLSVTDYSSALSRCRVQSTSAGSLFATSTDVILYGPNGDTMEVSNTPHPITLTFAATRPRCQHTACVWWDAKLSQWSEAGCSGVALSPTTYQCSCNHLTEFSLIAAGCPTTAERNGYLFYIIVYSILGAAAVAKLLYRIKLDTSLVPSRVASSKKGGSLHVRVNWTVAHTQHVMITLHCTLRALACATLGQFLAVDLLPARSVVLLGPYLLVFWMYTVLVFNWAALVHFAMHYTDARKRKVQMFFITTNVAIVATVIALIAVMTHENTTSTSAYTAVLAGTLVLSILTFASALAFILYAFLLWKALSAVESEGLNIKVKLLMFGIAASILLFLESVLHIVTAIAVPYSQNGSELGLLTLDSLFVVSMLFVYHTFMSSTR